MDEFSTKDRIEALMELARFRTAAREVRRNYEWRITLALWAALAAAILYLKTDHTIILITLLVLTVLAHIWWLYWHWRSSERDAYIAYMFVEEAEKLVISAPARELASEKLKEQTRFGRFLRHAPPVIAIFGTALLILLMIGVSTTR